MREKAFVIKERLAYIAVVLTGRQYIFFKFMKEWLSLVAELLGLYNFRSNFGTKRLDLRLDSMAKSYRIAPPRTDCDIDRNGSNSRHF